MKIATRTRTIRVPNIIRMSSTLSENTRHLRFATFQYMSFVLVWIHAVILEFFLNG